MNLDFGAKFKIFLHCKSKYCKQVYIVGNSRNIWIISFAGRIIDDFGKCKIKCKWRGESSFSARFRISSSKAKTTWYFKWRGWLGPCWSYYALRSHPSENCRDDTPLYYRGTIKAFASENIKKKMTSFFAKLTRVHQHQFLVYIFCLLFF